MDLVVIPDLVDVDCAASTQHLVTMVIMVTMVTRCESGVSTQHLVTERVGLVTRAASIESGVSTMCQ